MVDQNKKVLGFMLILKKNYLTIDLIATRKKYEKGEWLHL